MKMIVLGNYEVHNKISNYQAYCLNNPLNDLTPIFLLLLIDSNIMWAKVPLLVLVILDSLNRYFNEVYYALKPEDIGSDLDKFMLRIKRTLEKHLKLWTVVMKALKLDVITFKKIQFLVNEINR